MCNIVIFNNDLKFVKKYNNMLITNFDKIKIIEIATTKSELYNISQKHTIDFIFMNYEYYNKKSSQAIIKNINKKIIIVPKDFSKLPSEPDIVFIKENQSLISTINTLKNYFGNSTEIDIRKNVYKLLKSLKFDFRHKGTNFLLEAIVYCYLNKNKYLYDNLERNVYSIISKKYSVSLCVVKHSIIRTLNCINSNCLKNTFKNLDKITSKSVITEFVNSL